MLKEATERLYRILIRPSPQITDSNDSQKATLTTQLALFLTFAINSGVIYMSFHSTNPRAGTVLLIAECGFFLAYILSRTRLYRTAGLMVIMILLLMPLFEVLVSSDRSALSLQILLIWNVLTIIFAISLLSFRLSALFALLNVLTVALFPAVLPDITLRDIIVPIVFNTIVPLALIIFSYYDKRTEKKQMDEILDMNAMLEKELSIKTEIEEKLVYNATHDDLTKLPNRSILRSRIEHIIQYYKRHSDQGFAVIFMDLDRFKNINDTLGHNAGDKLLIEVSDRLREALREQDTISRLGGDEFVILLEEIKDGTEMLNILSRLKSALTKPVILGDEAVHISASLGIAVGDKQDNDPDTIISNADLAMYRAKKRSGFSFEFYESTMLNNVKTKLELETKLRQAIGNGEFLILYQPIVCTETGETAGFEALIRWKDYHGRMISPGEFIPVAEETGLIIPIGYWVMEQVCRQIRDWRKSRPERSFMVSVNLSNRQFEKADFIDRVLAIIDKSGIDPGYLKFELTESLIVDNSSETGNQLSRLKSRGCQILIDDFGTGYSSLSYLHSLPIDILKIDKSFIHRLSNKKENIVNTIINLAHSLNMEVVAEGVETEEQLNLVKSMGCEYIQGFYFSKPLESRKAEHFLK